MSELPLIYCAIDTPDLGQAKNLVQQVVSAGCGIKLGLEFFNMFGPQGVEALMNDAPDASLFLDLKFHDIPNTVAGAVNAISKAFAPDYLNIHAAGGSEMMCAARDAVYDGSKTRLLAVTILTSLDQKSLAQVGYAGSSQDNVLRLANLTQDAGLAGIVCSAHEIVPVRQLCEDDFVLMVPGIRPLGSDKGDQKRVMTPKVAMTAGATHLVIGRPITQAPDPTRAAQDILDRLN
jgi:orotidine-5'-phosphate decarboxylase